MLLRVTTHGQRVLFHVVNIAPMYEETRITLPAGTYNFRSRPNPMNLSWGDWLVLEEAELLKLGLDPDAIVGMSHDDLMLYNHSTRVYTDMVMDVEDITPAVTVAQLVAEVRPMNPARQVIPLRNHPNFTPSDQSRGSNILTLYCAGRHRRFLNPAARRECNG